MKKKIVIFLLFLIFFLALFLRIYFPYSKVFSNPVKYSADDGIYHMRLIENELLGDHFPRRIYFDPYTYFPYGTYHRFAPLYDQLLAGIIWLASFGKPTLEIINKISPFYPAVLGSLIVFPVFFIAKTIWNKKVALLSSFLIAISPPYLYRSLLGSTDHHVAEALFSTLAIMFLFLSFKTRKREVSGLRRELKENKKFWLFTFLTGVSLGLYFLVWNGALLFLFIFFLFIILYYFYEYIKGNSPSWILLMGIVIFFIPLLMISPFFDHPDLFHSQIYNIKHLTSFLIGIFVFVIIGILDKILKKKKIKPWLLPILFGFTVILFLILLKFVSPFIFKELFETLRAINTSLSPYKFARELTNEMRPLTLQEANGWFSSLFYLSLIALIVIFYEFISKRKPEYLLILIWTVIIILITGIIPLFGQKRFGYYLSVNISLLSGFLIIKGLEFGWQNLKVAQDFPKKSSTRLYLLVGSLLIIFNSIFFLVFPYPFNIGEPFPRNLPSIFQQALLTAKEGPDIRRDDFYEAMKWLRENTPDPDIDYYSLYKEPGINKETGEISSYSYPKKAYGVLGEWGIGHMITYYAHRIPNSNPFHQGIGQKKGEEVLELGEGIFFLETDEEKTLNYLEKLKTRYIITSSEMINPEGLFRTKVKWVQENLEGYLESESNTAPSKFDNSMAVRLHVLDGRGTKTEREVNGQKIEFYIKPLDHFRLIFESQQTVLFSSLHPEDEIKAVKLFEFIKGAKITGQTEPETEVFLSTEINTNQGRNFVYQKNITTKDGHFEFIVPYSTFGEGGRLPNQTQFAVFAKPYKLKIGAKEIEINVSEEEVLEGKTIEIKDI